jgi:hypothetical protein
MAIDWHSDRHLERFGPAIAEFGELPPQARRALGEALNIAVLKGILANKFILPPGKHAERLEAIAQTANKLLGTLDAEDGRLPTWAGPLLLSLQKRHVSLPLLTKGLLKLAEVAEQAAKTERARRQTGRGGSRRKGPGSNEVFLRSLFCIYADARLRHPESGHAIGFGGPLRRFIHAVYASIEATPPTEGTVKSAFNRWLKTNPPTH